MLFRYSVKVGVLMTIANAGGGIGALEDKLSDEGFQRRESLQFISSKLPFLAK